MNPKATDWDDYGREHSPWRQHALYLHHRLAEERIDRFLIRMNRSIAVLDLGCGDGYFLDRLRRMGFTNVTGVDPSGPMVERCRGRGLTARQGLLEDLPETGDADLVLLIQVLEHLDDPGAALARIRRLLKTEGRLLLAVPVCDSLLKRYHRFRYGVGRREQVLDWDPTHRHAFSRAALGKLLRERGFRVIRGAHCSNPFPWVERYGGKKLGELFQRISLGGMFGDILVILAQRN
jgi:SAM-dependent methyltransferase